MKNRITTGYNRRLAQWRVKCFYDSLVQGSNFVLLMNICAENPPLRQAPNRYAPLLPDRFDLTFVQAFCSFSHRSIKKPIKPEIFSLPNKSFDKERAFSCCSGVRLIVTFLVLLIVLLLPRLMMIFVLLL